MSNTREQEDYKDQVVVEKERQLVLYNDDVNTFDHVIECLMAICRHGAEQAEQCALIVHYKGKCAVKEGDYELLEPMCVALSDRGLSCEIH